MWPCETQLETRQPQAEYSLAFSAPFRKHFPFLWKIIFCKHTGRDEGVLSLFCMRSISYRNNEIEVIDKCIGYCTLSQSLCAVKCHGSAHWPLWVLPAFFQLQYFGLQGLLHQHSRPETWKGAALDGCENCETAVQGESTFGGDIFPHETQLQKLSFSSQLPFFSVRLEKPDSSCWGNPPVLQELPSESWRCWVLEDAFWEAEASIFHTALQISPCSIHGASDYYLFWFLMTSLLDVIRIWLNISSLVVLKLCNNTFLARIKECNGIWKKAWLFLLFKDIYDVGSQKMNIGFHLMKMIRELELLSC